MATRSVASNDPQTLGVSPVLKEPNLPSLVTHAQAILTATARPQGVSNSGVASAVSVVGTTVVPIDEPDCQKGGSGATAADDGGDGNPAVQVLQVGAACSHNQ
jgi:hypothetical protein